MSTPKTLVTTIFLLMILLALGQQRNINSKDGLFYLVPESNIHINNVGEFLHKSLALGANDRLIQTHTDVDAAGNTHVKYDLITDGLKREHENIIVHADVKGTIKFINGEYIPFTNVNSSPSINESTALNGAMKHIKAEKYQWEIPNSDSLYRAMTGDPSYNLFPKGELLIFKGSLAYRFVISAALPESSNEVYVDAHTGEVLRTNSLISHDTGIAHSRYSGVQAIETTSQGNSFRLADYTRGSGIETYNLSNSSTDYGTATEYFDNDNVWDEYETDKEVQDALDAHWAAGQVFDYWFNVHGRKSFDDGKWVSNGVGAKIISYVNYGTDDSDASWHTDSRTMQFGNGGSFFNGKTTLDAIAHEFAHGVDQFSSNLYNYQEPGALDEGIADIWATCVEHYVNGLNILPQPKEIWKFQSENIINGDSFRALDNPNENEHPDTYKGDFWSYTAHDRGGIHTNCTVIGHWFYLGSNGGNGVNDHGFTYAVNGIGISTMAEILYEAQKNYFTTETNYYTARILTIQAASMLYGESSQEAQTIIDAWDAVGVTDALANQPNYCIPEIDTIASNSEGYIIDVRPEDFYQNQTFPFIHTFKVGFADTTFFKTWIDADHNGTFDTDEVVFLRTYPVPHYEGNFTIPINTQTGFTRVRHIRSSQPINGPCDAVEKGDVEDIIVNILPTDYGACAPYGANKYNQGPSFAISWMQLEAVENSADDLLCDHNGVKCLDQAFSNTGYNPMPLPTYDMKPGSSYKLTLSEGYQTLAEVHWEVWIDYNQNRVFEESEYIIKTQESGYDFVRHTFDIPFSALEGETRMRVKVRRFNSPEGPCGNIGPGEVEDYKINILPCEPSAPRGISIAHLSNSLSAKISWSGGNGDYKVRIRPSSQFFWENYTTTEKTIILQEFDHPGTEYIVQVGGTCQGNTVWSSPQFTISNCIIPTNPQADQIQNYSARLTWDTMLNSSGQILDYMVYFREKPSDPFYPYWSAYHVSGSGHLQLTNLKANTEYQFKVRTLCEDADSNFAGIVTFRTKKSFIVKYEARQNPDQGEGVNQHLKDISLFPNPVKEELRILSASLTIPITAIVVDVSGRTIHTIQLQKGSTSYDVSALKPGVYFINISSGQERKSLKFIKE